MSAAIVEIQSCIDACHETVDAASRVLARHLGEQPMRDCLRMCLDVTDLCGTTIQMLQRASTHGARICEVLFDLCTTCARACDGWPSSECRHCATACRQCADAARAVAEA